MTEECKEWILELADSALLIDMLCKPGYETNTIAILMKAMWSLNREERGWTFDMGCYGIEVYQGNNLWATFDYSEYNNFEQETLQAALQYVFDNKG